MANEFSLKGILKKEDGGKTGRKSYVKRTYYDYTLLFLILFLIGFGLVMIYSISAYNATKYYDDATLFVRNQAKYALLGLVAMILLSKINYHIYGLRIKLGKLNFPLLFIPYGICIFLQFFVLIKGDGTNGSNRWIPIGSMKLQPSEISKVLLVLFVSYIVYVSPKALDRLGGFLRVFLFSCPLLILVALENLTTAIIMVGIAFIIPFVTSRKIWYYWAAGAVMVGAVVLTIVTKSYRLTRFQVWLDIENAPGGYQIRQGLYALGSGGLFGKGLGNSIQKLGYIPEVHTDMIFTCIVEELGIVGGLLLLGVFCVLLARIFRIACNAPDLFGSLIAVGVFVQIALQIFLNIAVVTNTIPSTGVPFPFISYGGSSLLFLMLELGLVLNVSSQIEYDAPSPQL